MQTLQVTYEGDELIPARSLLKAIDGLVSLYEGWMERVHPHVKYSIVFSVELNATPEGIYHTVVSLYEKSGQYMDDFDKYLVLGVSQIFSGNQIKIAKG